MKSREEILAILRAHEAELRAKGIVRLSLFGSVARGTATEGSDVDIAVELDPEARISGFGFAGLEQEIEDLLQVHVDLTKEPVSKDKLSREIDRDRVIAFT